MKHLDYQRRVRDLDRMTYTQLVRELARLHKEKGIIQVLGGPVSRDEHITAILELEGWD